MNLLAFDTCLDKTYVTLFSKGNFINKTILSTGENYHSAFLISTIVEVLKSANLTPTDLDCIATDIGPGSFTGIRACTTVARMLAQQLNTKAIGVSSLEILSEILGENDMVVLDARKNKGYVYDNEILGAVELEEIDELVKERRVITDNSLLERIKGNSAEAVSYQQKDYELGEILAKIALEKLEKDINPNWRTLKPLYIQPPPVYGKG